MCVAFCWSLKNKSQKHPSHWHYGYIEKEYVYDTNPFYLTF